MSQQRAGTFVTVADKAYFPGLVALLNSLRITGNDGPLVVIDAGLEPGQRERLTGLCDVRDPPGSSIGVHAAFLKPTVARLGLSGCVALIDSDIIVTADLGPVMAKAAAGNICMFEEDLETTTRRFEEWQSMFRLAGPLRSQPYVNAGVVALDLDRWQVVLERWHELCELVRAERSLLPWDLPSESRLAHPLTYGDQDVLNAMLMSEVDRDALEILDLRLASVPLDNETTRVLDRRTLRCSNRGAETLLLHSWDHPKPWLGGPRSSLRFDAYAELMARLLTADDVALRLRRDEVPVWLRDDLRARAVRRAPRRARQAAEAALRRLPGPLERRSRRASSAIARRIGL